MSINPKEGEYFKAEYPLKPWLVYGQCLKSGTDQLVARCYSEMCPDGESGFVPLSVIFAIISEDEFQNAKRDGWPR